MNRDSLDALLQTVGRHTGQAARDVLSQIRAEDPSHFVLHLVSAAVACQAQRIQVRNDELDLVIEWSGQPPNAQQMIELYSHLSQRGPARYLAFGLNLAFATGIGELHVDTWDGRSGVRLALTPNSQSHQLLKMDPFQGQGWCVRIRCLERTKFRALARAVSNRQGGPECEAVCQRCNWAGPDVLVDRVPVNDEVAPGRVLAWACLEPAVPMEHLRLRYARPRLGMELEHTPEAPFYALLTFDPHGWDWVGLRAIVNGVSLPTSRNLRFRDLTVLLSAADLETDAYFKNLVSTPGLETMVEIIETTGARLAAQLLARREQIGFDQAEMCARVFEDLSRFYVSKGRQDLSLQALFASLELREQVLGATHPDLVDGWSELLDLNRQVGNEAAVLPIQQRLIPLLRASGENHLRKHRVAEASLLLKRALELEEQLPDPPSGLAQRYHDLAVLVKENRLAGSEELFQKSLQLQRSCPQASPEDALQSIFELADRHRANRRLAEAEIQARQALEKAEELFGQESKELVKYLKLLSEILKAANRYGEATDFESRAMLLRFKRT